LLAVANKGLVEAANRWPVYCEKNSFNPATTRYFSTYCLRRVNGSILDYMRAQDWVPRTIRDRARLLRDTRGQGQDRTEQQMAEDTGLTRAQVSETLVALGRRPVQFDPIEHDIPVEADTESSALVDDLLRVSVEVMQALPLPVQFSVILTFYYNLSLKQVAEVLGLPSGEVAVLQRAGVLAVHNALSKAAKDR